MSTTVTKKYLGCPTKFTSKAFVLKKDFFKAVVVMVLLLLGRVEVGRGQATLPFTGAGTTSGSNTMPTGFTQSGLGTAYASSTSPWKFDTQGDYVILNFTGAPGTLTYSLANNTLTGSYVFDVLVSDLGVTYTSLTSHTAITSGSFSAVLSSSTRFVKWIYTTKSGGNVGLGSIGLTAQAGPPSLTSPTATTITPNSALLGANLTGTGTSAITASGIAFKTSTPVAATDNASTGGPTTTGVYTQNRTGLTAQTLYYYAGYATNTSGTSLSAEGSFRTLSSPPTAQPGSFSTTPGSSSLVANWTTATFPGSGATQAGYAIIYSTSTPTLGSANGAVPSAGVGTIVNVTTASSLTPATTTTISGLVNGTLYNLLIVPYTWDGANPATYNYLTASALTTTGTPAAVSYTWNGGISGAWSTAANWTPSGVPSTGDAITFSTGGNISVTSVPTVSLSGLTVSTIGTNVTLTVAAATNSTITLSNATTALSIAAGTSLNLNGNTTGSLTVAYSGSGNTATIAGSMNLQLGSGTTGAGKYLATNSTTTVSGTMTTNISNAVITSSTSNLIFSGTGKFQLIGTTANTIPTATWQTGSTVQLSQSGSTAITMAGLNGQTFSNFTVDATHSGTINFNASTSTVSFAISGDYTQSGTPLVELGGGTATTNITVGGAFQKTAGTIFTTTSTTSALITLTNTSGKNLQCNSSDWVNFTIASSAIYTLNGILSIANNPSIVTINGTLDCGDNIISGTTSSTFTLSSGATLKLANIDGITATGATGAIQTGGTRTFNVAAKYIYNGTLAQVTGTGLPASLTGTVTINNAAGVTLSQNTAFTGVGALVLTSGKLNTNAKTLTLVNSTAGSTTSYIVTDATGTVIMSAVTTAKTLPIGTSSSYAPLIITAGTSTAYTTYVTGTVPITVFDASKTVALAWSINGTNAPSSVKFQWNSGDQGGSFTSNGTCDLGRYASPASVYTITAAGSAGGTDPNTITATSGFATSSNLYVLGNTNAVRLDVPTITTTVAANAITDISASSGGQTITGSLLSATGVVWNTSTAPTVALSTKTNDGTTTSNFTSSLTSLSPQTQYYVRAYATNAAGTGYANEMIFGTLSSPATAQASGLSATATSTSNIDLSWSGATFPTSGATSSGYILLSATGSNTPILGNSNGAAPTAGTNTTLVATFASGDVSYSNASLAFSTIYNYVLIPFTWDGVNASTYHYLTAIAPTASATTQDPTNPVITASGTLSTLSTTYGTASSTTTFTISGVTMQDGISITPPAGFEVSTSATFSSNIGNNGSPLVVGAAGTIASTPIYVRLLATAGFAGSPYTGNITLSSTNAADVTVATASSTVAKKALTINGLTANNKDYNALTDVSVTGTAIYNGLVNSESFPVSDVVSFAFSTASVGNNKPITQTGTYSVPSNNYSITQPTLTANITAASLTITASAQSKNFGTTSTTTGATSLLFTTSGLQNTDAVGTVTLSYSTSGNLATAVAGTYTITPSAASFSTGASSNYSITYATGTLTIAAVAPGAPTIGTPTAGNGQVTVAYTAPGSNGGSAITSYTATSSPGGFTGTVNQATSGSIVVTGLTNGTAYTFTVTATNIAGTGTASSASASSTPRTVPDAPTIGTAAVAGTSGTASVAFTAPAFNGGAAITSFTVTSSPGSFTGTGATSPISVTGLSNGTPYTFTVTATNTAGSSAASAASNSVTPYTVPGAPTIGTVTAGNGQATVTFTAPGSNGGSVITSYTATSSPGNFTGTLSQAGSGTITVTGLTNGTTYTFTVKANNAAGVSTSSTASNSVTPGLQAPIATAATAILANGFTSNWDAVTGASSGYLLDVSTNANFAISSAATLIEGFELGLSTSGYANSNLVLGSGTWTFVDGGLESTSNFNTGAKGCQLKASTGTIISPAVNSVGIVTFYAKGTAGNIFTIKKIVGGVTTTVTTKTITASWAQYSVTVNDNSAAVQISIQTGANFSYIDDVVINYTSSTPSFVSGYNAKAISGQSTVSSNVTGLTEATTYYYRVRATDAASTSAYSNVITVTTKKTPTVTPTIGSYTYNGSAQGPNSISVITPTPASVTFSYVGVSGTTYAASSTRPTNAGTYTVTATVEADDNYVSASSAATAFTIGVATPAVTPTVVTYTYTGSSQGPNAASNTGTGTSYTYSYVGVGGTSYLASATAPSNAGNYTVTATVTADGNYGAASSAPTSFTIDKAALTITANNQSKCSGTSFTFAGTEFTNGTLMNGDAVSSVTLTSAGSGSSALSNAYSIVASAASGTGLSNYTISYVNGTFTVTSNSWTGGTGSWSDAANWSCGVVPSTGSSIVISSGTPLLDEDFSLAGGLTISGTGGLTINPLKTLTISGSADFGGNLVTVKSNAAGSGSIGKITGTLSNATNVTVERYIPNNGFRSWRLLSVPTYGTQTINGAWQEGNTPMGNNNPGLGTIISGTTTALGFDDVSTYPGMLSFNGNNFVGIPRTTIPISTNKAYFLYVRGDRTVGVSSNTSTNTATTLRTNGTLYQGTQITSNIPANSYALIGNPFTSSIDFNSIIRSGTVNNSFYIWDSKINSGSSLGVYQTFSATNGFACSLGGGSFTQGAVNTTIQSGQAFFVENGASNGSVSIPESSKVTSSGSTGYKFASELVKIDSRLYSIAATGTTMADANVVVFDSAYSNAVDGDDASKLSNTGENLAIGRNAESLVIEGRNPINAADTIFFKMWNMKQQSYQLEFVPQNLGAQNLTARLEDSYLNTSTAVDLSTNTLVDFTVNATPASYASNRFRIVFAPAVVLPVSFQSISASRKASNALVNWKVGNEINIRSYEVERSTNGSKYDVVGIVAANAASAYSFTDLNVPSSNLFYRVKSIGAAGDVKYSTVVKLAAESIKPSFAIVPNPVEGAMMNIQFGNQPKGMYQLRLVNAVGQQVTSIAVTHPGGFGTHSVNIPSSIAKGMYQLEITAPDKTINTQKVVVISAH